MSPNDSGPFLEGASNFRDFGGHPARDGRRVRRGLLYRTDALGSITEQDRGRLAALGLSCFFDLRTAQERAHAPLTGIDTWLKSYRTRDYTLSLGNFRFDRTDDPDPEELRALVIENYRKLPYEQAPSYREAMLAIAEGELPLLIGCTAGKDRTGIFAGILLDYLGVERDAIMRDYCATNASADNLWANFARIFAADGPRNRAPWEPMISCEAGSLEASFTTLEQNHGSVQGYLTEVLELSDDAKSAIRDRLLEDDG